MMIISVTLKERGLIEKKISSVYKLLVLDNERIRK